MSAVYLTPEQVLAIDEWLSQIERSTEPLTDVVITQGEHWKGFGHDAGPLETGTVLVSYGPVFATFMPDGTMIPEEV